MRRVWIETVYVFFRTYEKRESFCIDLYRYRALDENGVVVGIYIEGLDFFCQFFNGHRFRIANDGYFCTNVFSPFLFLVDVGNGRGIFSDKNDCEMRDNSNFF